MAPLAPRVTTTLETPFSSSASAAALISSSVSVGIPVSMLNSFSFGFIISIKGNNSSGRSALAGDGSRIMHLSAFLAILASSSTVSIGVSNCVIIKSLHSTDAFCLRSRSGVRHALAPEITIILLSPFLSTSMIAIPVGVSGIRLIAVVSTPA